VALSPRLMVLRSSEAVNVAAESLTAAK